MMSRLSPDFPIAPMVRAAAAIVALVVAVPASAAFGPACPPGGCVFEPDDGSGGIFDFDYTVPPTDRLYRWTIAYHSADPLASITLAPPNQTEIITTIRNGADFDFGYDGNPPYVFEEGLAPGRSVYAVRAPRAFDRCALPGPDSEICAADVHIWGNGTFLRVTGTAPVLATFNETAVPEPASWALLIAGFGLTGSALRRRRRAPFPAAQ